MFTILIVLIGNSYGAEDNKQIIKPIKTSSDIRVLSSEAWLDCNKLPKEERETLQLLYVRGFWDALSWFALSPKIQEVISAYEGMDLQQIVDTINKFYSDYPQWREWKPSSVMIVVIPRLRKGLSPLPSDNE